MKNYKKSLGVLIITLVTASIIAGLIYYNSANRTSGNNQQISPPNSVTTTSKISLAASEKEQLVKSVDEFMNEYKLPKGIRNSYILSIEKRLNDSIEVIVNPGQKGDVGNLIIYVRKTNNTWQVDPSGGPWCTLEEFDKGNCY